MTARTPFWARLDWAYAAAFAAFAALIAAVLVAVLELAWPRAIALGAALAIAHGVVCRSADYVARVSPLLSVRLPATLSTFAAAASAAGLAFAALAAGGAELVGAPAGADLGAALPALFGLGAGAYLAAAAYFYAVAARREALRLEARALEAELVAVEAELRALAAKLDPHFVFNALNSIAALAAQDPEATRAMCVALAEQMRGQLRAGDVAFHTLAEEIGVARGYLAIERVRFRDRMEVEERIEPGCLAWPVPPLLLQPVVENAVKHGVAPSAEPTVISVEARIDGGELLVIAENPIPAERAPRAARGGLGLDLVRRRLAAAYGGRARFEAGAVDGRFRAALFLPRETGGGA